MADLDVLFDTYARMLPELMEWARPLPEGARRLRLRVQADDQGQGVRRRPRHPPGATLSNVGIYGTGQAFEALLLRMRAPAPGGAAYGDDASRGLRKVIPSFLTRVDRPERGGAWTEYLTGTPGDRRVVDRLLAGGAPEPRPAVVLTDFDPDGEEKLWPRCATRTRTFPRTRSGPGYGASRPTNARPCCARTWGAGEPAPQAGQAFERTDYRFDVLCDYGAFRDLQRHRMLTIEWQPLSPAHGYDVPEAVAEAGLAEAFEDAMAVSAALYSTLAAALPEQAPCGVPRVPRPVRRPDERPRAMHMLELRTSPRVIPRTVGSVRRCTA